MSKSSCPSVGAFAVALAILAAFAALLLATPRSAEAGTNSYCGNQAVSGWAYGVGANRCNGVSRQLYAVYGWGDQTGVCVGASYGVGGGASVPEACAPATQGAYSNWGTSFPLSPYIYGTSQWNSTVVHGVAYIP
jgi:hypothetical protein